MNLLNSQPWWPLVAEDGGDWDVPAVDALEDLEALNEAVEARLGKMTILLLGRGPELDRRQNLKECLESEKELDSQILIMEDYPDVEGEEPGDKWDRLIANEDPRDFIVIVPEEGQMSGVGPEYGRIRERFEGITRHHVHFFWPADRNPDEPLDPYMGTMMGKAHAQPFRDEAQLCRRVYRLLQNLALQDVQGERPHLD